VFKYKGYRGTLLRVDLSKNKLTKTPLPIELAELYIGGTGFCARILWDEVGPQTDPLGPENRLIFATGPLTGTFFPPSGRFVIAAKSPLTGIWGEAHCGGHWGPELKYAGYDLIILQGCARKPVYLNINDSSVELRDAAHLWNMNTRETTEAIRAELKDDTVEVACIGQAGERKVKFASVICDFYHAAGRSGMGAVMGSKNVKAVAVRGSGDVEVADPEGFLKVAEEAYEKVTVEWREVCEGSLGKYGTPNLVTAINEIGRLPTKNHLTGFYDNAEAIGGHILRDRYRVSRQSCLSCGIQCKYISYINNGLYKGTLTGGPEYESIMALGSNCFNEDVEAIIHANLLCNLYGLDTISTGKVISFAMECYANGIVAKRETGIDLSWGNPIGIVELIHRIAKREGFGNILADGVRAAAKCIGKGAERYAMHVKGLEISGQDGRAQQSVALTHAIGCRGADHLRSLSSLEELGFTQTLATRFGEEYVQGLQNLHSTQHKGLLVKDMEDLYAIVDSLLLCKYGTMWPPIYYFDDIAKLLPPLTGMKRYADISNIRMTAERICTLRRAFNVREGLTRSDDCLPERFLKEPMPNGPAKGMVAELEPMLEEYYQLRGWDSKTGWIPRAVLKKFGLSDVADELERLGKLP